MSTFQTDVKKYEKLIKNDLLNLNGKNDRVEKAIRAGNAEYKANVMLWISCARPYIPVEFSHMLIERFRANPNFVAPFGVHTSCLMAASYAPISEKVCLLLENGANSEYMSNDTLSHINDTALSRAVEGKQSLNCRILMLFGANPDVELGQNNTPLTIATERLQENPTDEEMQRVLHALQMPRSESTTTLVLFINDAMRLGFDNDFSDIDALNGFSGTLHEEEEVDVEGGSSRKTRRKRRINRRQKSNKKRRTYRRK